MPVVIAEDANEEQAFEEQEPEEEEEEILEWSWSYVTRQPAYIVLLVYSVRGGRCFGAGQRSLLFFG